MFSATDAGIRASSDLFISVQLHMDFAIVCTFAITLKKRRRANRSDRPVDHPKSARNAAPETGVGRIGQHSSILIRVRYALLKRFALANRNRVSGSSATRKKRGSPAALEVVLDPIAAAKLAKLRHVSDQMPGLRDTRDTMDSITGFRMESPYTILIR